MSAQTGSIGPRTTPARGVNPRSRVAWKDIEEMGFHDGWSWVKYGSEFYTIDAQPMADTTPALAADEIRVHKPYERTNFGTVETGTDQYRGKRASEAAYLAAIAKDAKPSKLGRKPNGPISITRRLQALRGRSETVLNGPERRDSKEIMRDITRVTHGVEAAGTTTGAYLAATPAAVGPAALIERAQTKHGAVVAVSPFGRLALTSPGGDLSEDMVVAFYRHERLVLGELTGHPVLCEWRIHDGPAPEATEMLAVDIPACADCAAGRETEPAADAPGPRRGPLGRFLPANPA